MADLSKLPERLRDPSCLGSIPNRVMEYAATSRKARPIDKFILAVQAEGLADLLTYAAEQQAEVERLRNAAIGVMPTLFQRDSDDVTPYCAECGETDEHDDDCPVVILQRTAGIALTPAGWELKGKEADDGD